MAVAVALGFQVPAFAQASLEEVIVTAQRTEQSLQDVPIAVTALSADDLVEKQVVTFSDLQLNVPSLQFGQGQYACLLYTSPSPRDATLSRMPSSA